MLVFMYAWIWVLWRALTGTSQKLCALDCLRDWNGCILTNERFSDIWSEACDRWKRSDDSDNDCDFCMINRSINRSIYRSTDRSMHRSIHSLIQNIYPITYKTKETLPFIPSEQLHRDAATKRDESGWTYLSCSLSPVLVLEALMTVRRS